ncbi:MAG: hypothetical protein LBD68_02010 [Zoogloeaceae bacterium]|jgi:hypothetical protein|nr:hypothetical protein [Zoogloeaceae bacterium]
MTFFLIGMQEWRAAQAGISAPLPLAPIKHITVRDAPPLTPTASAQVDISLYARSMALTLMRPAASPLAAASGGSDADGLEAAASGSSGGTADETTLAQLRRQGWDGNTTPEAFMRRQAAIARGEDPDGGRFGKFQNRLDPYMVTFFSINDKKIIGEAYEMAAATDEDLARIDKLVIELGALRIQQHMKGELIRSVSTKKVNPDDVPYEPDIAHLPLLGEMKRMAARANR